jgi:hypothetical protein
MMLLAFLSAGLNAAAATAATEAAAPSGFCAFDDVFGAGAPPYYVAYKLGQQVRESGTHGCRFLIARSAVK